MRHNGLRRKSKPFPGASDLHYPLSDSTIEKIKPHYFQQLFAVDILATFVSRRPQQKDNTAAAAQWFDYQVKQKSNLETEILTTIDAMLMSGRACMKVMWDSKTKRLKFTAVRPQHIVVPQHTDKVEEADRIVHIKIYSEEAYRREKHLNQNDEVIQKLLSQEEVEEGGDSDEREVRYTREGITKPAAGKIIVWEVYEMMEGEWHVKTFSPVCEDETLRDEFKVPYNHGAPPFVSFQYEIKDQGWHSPRGIPELLAMNEAELCRLLNDKNDAMTFYNRPLFKTSRDVPNQANLRFVPGQILPEDVSPVPMPQPPISFDTMMNQTREIAEQRVSAPDFGLNQSLANTERRTATEINAIQGLFSQSADLRLRVFRISLGSLYKMAWSLLTQYNGDDLDFWYQDDAQKIDKKALHGDYGVQPTGSGDGVNRTLIYQKALARFQMLNGDPYTDQLELRRSMHDADDSGLTRRLLIDPGLKAATEAEEQAMEITIMLQGFPAAVEPNDDHETHIKTTAQFMQSRDQLGKEVDQVGLERLLQHIQQHLEALSESDPKKANMLKGELQAMAQQAQQQAEVEAQANQNGNNSELADEADPALGMTPPERVPA